MTVHSILQSLPRYYLNDLKCNVTPTVTDNITEMGVAHATGTLAAQLDYELKIISYHFLLKNLVQHKSEIEMTTL